MISVSGDSFSTELSPALRGLLHIPFEKWMLFCCWKIWEMKSLSRSCYSHIFPSWVVANQMLTTDLGNVSFSLPLPFKKIKFVGLWKKKKAVIHLPDVSLSSKKDTDICLEAFDYLLLIRTVRLLHTCTHALFLSPTLPQNYKRSF